MRVFTGWVGANLRDVHAPIVARTPCIPPELTSTPFTLDEARAGGLTLSALKGKAWRRLSAELYCFAELSEDPWLLLSAWQRSLPRTRSSPAQQRPGCSAWTSNPPT